MIQSEDRQVSFRLHNNTSRRVTRRASTEEGGDRFVCDTGGGQRPTITERAWRTIGEESGLTTELQPYQTNEVSVHQVVSAVTKARIKGRLDPVLLMVHYATYITIEQDPLEKESLLTTMDMGDHGIYCDSIHPSQPRCGITVGKTFLPFEHDHECIYFDISKPTEDEMALYEVFELNSKEPPKVRRTLHKRTKRKREDYNFKFADLPMIELRKRFALLPEETIKKTLENTTQYYTDVTEETRNTPMKHFRKRFKALQYNRQNEEVATDFTYLSEKTSQGHKGGQFFAGVKSKKWSFHPLKLESSNVNALTDYIRESGAPSTLRSDNAKSEIGKKNN